MAFVEQTQGVAVEFLGLAIDGRHPAQVVERNCADDARRYLVLQIEDAAEGAVEAVGRKVRARRRIDEPCGNADPIVGLLQAPFQDIAHATDGIVEDIITGLSRSEL